MKTRILCGVVAVTWLACGEGSATQADTLSVAEERTRLAQVIAPKEVAAVEMARNEPEPELSVASVERDDRYDPHGKRDPFRSFTWDQVALQETQDSSETPLERFDIGQLSLVAVVWKQGSSRALLQDPSGMNYIVTSGSKVGKNRGLVTKIDDNLVVVRETYVDFAGAETTKEIQMRLRGSQGG
ncbi:pilus assembly protein PilP [Myxococcota bacterium]|nr:pilus assembly protein PilP [Myxococcota bacterium]